MPPLLEIPAPVTALTAQQTGPELRITIPIPQLTTEGTRPKHLERLELYLAYAAPGAPQPDFPSPPLHTWSAGELRDSGPALTHELRLEAARIGQRAWLAVRVKNHRALDGGLSNIVAVDIANLPEAPHGLVAAVTENGIDLRWNANKQSVFGASAPAPTAVQYEIFRALTDGGTQEKLGTTSTGSFRDETIALGNSYRYSVRAIVPTEVSVAATAFSEVVDVAALDRFAPAAPSNLRAIAVTGAVELAWSPNSETDLAGYNVYREPLGENGQGTAPKVKLNAAPLDIPLYRDSEARAASRYRYTTTAIDRDGNESVPSNEETVETE